MRVCQFRHDGNLELAMQRRPQGRRVRKTNTLFYSPATACQTGAQPARRSVCLSAHVATTAHGAPYPSFAVIEIFAFSTFDTGQPFSAASAYF